MTLRQRNGITSRNRANHERPRHWIEIAVPALISEEIFALAQEQLEQNKRHSPRRTVEPSLLQGMLVCERCGYGLYRTSTQTSARKLHYYRCIGSDAYRHLKGAVCENPPVRQDQLDAVVWTEVLRLLEDPRIIQEELDRRLEAARNADPLKRRQEQLQRDHARLSRSMDRLLTAYQDGLMSLEQLRCRMPELRRQDQAIQAELQSLETAAADQTKYLRLVETLGDFRGRLRARADTLDVPERQKILRLLVKEVLVGRDTITVRHSIRIPTPGPDPNLDPRPPHQLQQQPTLQAGPCYLLRSGSRFTVAQSHTPFEQQMRRKGYQLTRYADDWVVTCESAAEARAAVAAALRILSELGVQLHPQKTRIVHVRQGCEFLGYKIKRGQRQPHLPPGRIRSGVQPGALYAYPREKSIRHFMDQVRALTSRRVPHRTTELIEELNPVLRGWGHHYKRAHVRKLFHRLDGWIVRRIRSHRFRRWRNGGWRQLPETKLYGEYGLVNLVQLIPSIAPRRRESS